MTDRRLALASLDPNAAIAAAAEVEAPRSPVIVVPAPEGPEPYELVLSVEVEHPKPLSWWRFAVFWLLVRLAARVCKFRFEITKTSE